MGRRRRGMISDEVTPILPAPEKEPTPPEEKKAKETPFANTELQLVGPVPKQPSLFGPQDEVINALEMEVSSAIVEIERLREQIEKREEKITALTNGRLDVLKSALAQAMKFRKDREKEIASEPELGALPF